MQLFKSILSDEKIREIVELVPMDWFYWEGADETPEEIKEVYIKFLNTRLSNSEIFIKEAKNARKTLI